MHTGLITPSRHHRRQQLGGRHLVVAIRTHQQQTIDRRLAEHQIDDSERCAPGPLQVIEEHDHRPGARGDRRQHLRCTSLRPCLGSQRIARIRGHLQQRPKLRQRSGQQACVLPDRCPHSVANIGQRFFGLGQQQPTQRP